MTGVRVVVEENQESAPAKEAFAWSVRLSDKAPWKRAVIVAVAVMAGVVGILFLGQPLLGLLGFAIILASTAEYWLGSSYKVDAGGVSARTGLSVSSLPWTDVKRVVVSEGAAMVSPLAEAGRLDPFRGVLLRFGGDREQILGALRTFGGEDVRFLGN